jgi:hypothetical protein
VAGDEEGQIAQQRHQPAGKVGIGATDMGIKRFHRQQVTDHRHMHVDEDQELDQRTCYHHRLEGECREIEIDDIGGTTRQDRDHEGAEKALDRP